MNKEFSLAVTDGTSASWVSKLGLTDSEPESIYHSLIGMMNIVLDR